MKTEAKIVPAGMSRPVRELPTSWTRAAGMLRRHKRALELHVKKVRQEWHRRRA